MRYCVVAVGRIRDAALRAACDKYLARLKRYTRIEELEVKDAVRLVKAVPEEALLVALERGGEPWDSLGLARRTAEWDGKGRDVAFAVGGADGLPPAFVHRADLRWSLSALTFPHELARLILLEQLYRAFTIRRGEPYHRGGRNRA